MTYFTTGAQLQAALNTLPASKVGNFVAFDPFFYGQQYMGAYAGTLSPIEHFVQIGADRGYKPNATFDPTYYANTFADLKGLNSADLLYHFMKFGLDEGRTPNAALASFDGKAYLAANADVATFVNANLAQFNGSVTNGALAHYVKFGAAEGRAAPGTSVSNGTTFTLTAGIDDGAAFTGTAGNDTFKAPVLSAAGVEITTLNSADVIDGGAGVDSLQLSATQAHNNALVGTVKNIEKIAILGSDFIGSALTQAQLDAIALAQTNLVTAEATLATAQATLATAQTTLGQSTYAQILIDAAVNAAAASFVDPNVADDDTAVALNAILVAINGTSVSAASVKAAAISAANAVDPTNSTDADYLADLVSAVTTATAGSVTTAATAVTSANTAVTSATTAVNTATSDLAVAEAAANPAIVDAAFFQGSTEITVDGVMTGVTGVTTQDVIFNAGKAGVSNSVSYGATTTEGNVTVGNISGALTLTGAKLATANIDGSVKAVSATVPGTLAIADGSGTDTIKTLNLNLSNDATVVFNGSAVKTVVSTGTADLAIDGIDSATTVTLGAGNDTLIDLDTTSVKDVAATTSDETVNVTVDTGAGDDTVNMWANGNGLTTLTTGAGDDYVGLSVDTASNRSIGTVNVNLGAGDDTYDMWNSLESVVTKLGTGGVDTTSNVKIEGGEGTDTLGIYDTSITAATYERLASNITGFETIEFYEGGSFDASKLSQFSTLSTDGSTTLTKVAAAQLVESGSSLTITAKDYVLDSDAVTDGNQPTYAGTLNVEQKVGTGDWIDAAAATLNLTLNAEVAADGSGSSSGAWLYGADVKTVNVTLESARGTGVHAGDEATSGFYIGGEGSSTGLTTLTISGQGYAFVEASQTGGKLATIDLSGMTEFLNLDDAGDQVDGVGDYGYQNLSTSWVWANGAVAESIILGGAHDQVWTNSTGAKMDTITGFTLVDTTTAGVADVAKSDMLSVDSAVNPADVGTGAYAFSKITIDAGNNTLTLALDQAAKGTADNVVFTFGGDTYVYVDASEQSGALTTYDSANDTLIKLVGTYNLDSLVDVINNVA